MNPLQRVFNYQGQQVRTVVKDGEPWFVAKDVCDVLGIANSRDAVSRLSDKQKAGVGISDGSQMRQVTVISEGGVYKLVFRSNKPEAEQFSDWVAEEVLPSIRKTGQYIAQPKSQSELILMLAQQNVENEKRLRQLEERANAAHHRIDNIDKIDTIGDLQQRLNAMIRKYAADNGLSFQRAWREFKQAFNTAYRTNLTMLIENYKMKHGIKKLTMPEYLSKVDRLEDAIRVADKLLNRAS